MFPGATKPLVQTGRPADRGKGNDLRDHGFDLCPPLTPVSGRESTHTSNAAVDRPLMLSGIFLQILADKTYDLLEFHVFVFLTTGFRNSALANCTVVW